MSGHYQGAAAEQLALNTFIKLVRATESFLVRTSPLIAEADLTTSQFGVLEALYHLGPLCQKELAGKILKSSGNMTMVIDNLEKRLLVKRERDSEDRRYYLIHLTDKGQDLITDLFPRHAANLCREMSCLTDQEKLDLGRLCKKLGIPPT